MFEIIEKLSSPIKLPADKNIKLLPGNIVKLIRTKTDIYCTLSDSLSNFGIVTGATDEFGLVPILSDGAIIITDLFEETLEYRPSKRIYSNDEGLITTRKIRDDSLLLGYVIAGNTLGRNYIEIKWL